MAEQTPYYQFGSYKFSSKKEVYEKAYLQAIVDSYNSGRVDKTTGLENPIRDRIVWDLQNHNPITAQLYQLEILDIIPERINMITQNEKSRADICFHWSPIGKFDVECKRVFQQPSGNKVYLTDGLIRFVELKYAKNNDYAGMIGFVVSGNITTIIDQITKETHIFHKSEDAIKDSEINWEYSFSSIHKRIDERSIQIYHLFFDFNS
jgi:hypothetical protein